MKEEHVSPNGSQKPQNLKPVEVMVVGLLNDDATDNPVVVLQSREDDRVLLMWIGEAEAEAIDLALQKAAPKRPLTHRLLLNILGALGGVLTNVVIDRLKAGTYYASLFVRTKESVHLIDARPSDAVALALTNGCSLAVERVLFDKVSTRLFLEGAKPQRKIEINLQFVPPPPPPPSYAGIDSPDESHSLAQVNTLMPRVHMAPDGGRPIHGAALSPEDIERIKTQLESARTREANN